ncbi:RcnB family protein [Rhodanobacter sp. AS-Z3]|uniref:RcnB family protein n=1 Tax=Rhodanobacter sp. AS-Z3 TaxID=3031330 RepID=UPI00247960E7|nr:RcnB family protein [Rhodanobacter sp. AS-Z3]WEN16678.1 RcnB family protein [Rhodanobacter sp. AS-Z3]
MKKLLSLSAACGVMLMFASGSVLAQDHDRDHGHDRDGYEQSQDHHDNGHHDRGHHDDRHDHDRDDHRDDRHDYRGHEQVRYVDWHDRGRHEGWYRRGGYLPVEYRTRYVVTDWRRDRLREPPRGYHWVRSDNGDYLLVAVATGVIVDLLLNH